MKTGFQQKFHRRDDVIKNQGVVNMEEFKKIILKAVEKGLNHSECGELISVWMNIDYEDNQ